MLRRDIEHAVIEVLQRDHTVLRFQKLMSQNIPSLSKGDTVTIGRPEFNNAMSFAIIGLMIVLEYSDKLFNESGITAPGVRGVGEHTARLMENRCVRAIMKRDRCSEEVARETFNRETDSFIRRMSQPEEPGGIS